jgi:hypothetical protein
VSAECEGDRDIRFYLDQQRRLGVRALLDLAIDSKLRGCDLLQMKIGGIFQRWADLNASNRDAVENEVASTV